jgi:hypothetical protein
MTPLKFLETTCRGGAEALTKYSCVSVVNSQVFVAVFLE